VATDSELIPSIPPGTKLRRNLFVLILLGLGVYLFLPQLARIEHAFRVVSTLSIPLVALSIGAQVASYLGSGYLLRTVIKLAAKPISVVDGALLTAGANSIGTLGGGIFGTAGMTYLWLRRRGVNSGAAGLGGWLPIFLNNATLAVVSLAGLAVLLSLKKSSGVLVAGLCLAILILAGGAGFLLWCLAYREKLLPMAMGITGFVARLRHKVQDRPATEAAVGRLLGGWDALLEGGWHGPAFGALLNTGFDMLTLAFLFLAAGHGVTIASLVAGYGVPQLLGKLTLILGGVGVVEAGMVGLYATLGVPRPIAVVVVLTYRLLSFWLPTLAGVALATYFERSTANRPSI
jgi:glycosyltransferase 2 family protein